MFVIILLLSLFSVSFALPNRVNPQNVITVPPNCPEGQELIDGVCRDVWKSNSITPSPEIRTYGNNVDSKNMITVPPNCPPGQQLINGQCRDVWRGGVLSESKVFEELLQKLWPKLASIRKSIQHEDNSKPDVVPETYDASRNIITVPNQCPKGYRPDALGICRKIF